MTGGCIFMNGSPVSWRAGRLTFTSLSSCEGEYVAATWLTIDVKVMRYIKEFLHNQSITEPTVIFCDNKSAVMLSDSNTSSKRMKHIATRIAFLREAIQDKHVVLYHIRTNGQVADIFTKPLGAATFHTLRPIFLG